MDLKKIWPRKGRKYDIPNARGFKFIIIWLRGKLFQQKPATDGDLFDFRRIFVHCLDRQIDIRELIDIRGQIDICGLGEFQTQTHRLLPANAFN